MGDNVGTWISTIEAQAERPLLQTGRLAREWEKDSSPKTNGFIAVIESRIFLQECIRRSMQSAFSLPILTCSTLSELELGLKAAPAAIVIVSWMEASNEVNTNVLNALAELVPNVPVFVLAQKNDVDLARTAIRHGAKGYIPCTLGFDIAVEAMRFLSWRVAPMCRWTACLRRDLFFPFFHFFLLRSFQFFTPTTHTSHIHIQNLLLQSYINQRPPK